MRVSAAPPQGIIEMLAREREPRTAFQGFQHLPFALLGPFPVVRVHGVTLWRYWVSDFAVSVFCQSRPTKSLRGWTHSVLRSIHWRQVLAALEGHVQRIFFREHCRQLRRSVAAAALIGPAEKGSRRPEIIFARSWSREGRAPSGLRVPQIWSPATDGGQAARVGSG